MYEVCFKTLDKYYKLISFDFDFIEDNDLALAGINNSINFTRNNGLNGIRHESFI